MKKILFISIFFFSVNCAFSQNIPVYGYCTLTIDGSAKKEAVSDVFDARYLPTNGISINDGSYGKMSLDSYYELVAKKWFNNLLVKNGYDWSNFVTVFIRRDNLTAITCPTNNEKGCFLPTKNDAEIARDKVINYCKNNGWTIIYINN